MAKAFTQKEISEGVITDLSTREKLAVHIEVLDRAGKLLTMPKVNMATTKQIAEFFGVPEKTIEKVYDRNKEEFEKDGAKPFSLTDFKTTGCRFENVGKRGITGLVLDDGSLCMVPTRGLRLFPKRAVLRIAMLLTGSEVAKAVRTALLNLTEKVEQKAPAIVSELVQEQSDLLQSLAMAFTSGDITKTTESFLKLSAWQSGKLNEARAEIAELSTENSELAAVNQELGETNQTLVATNHELATANENLGTVNRMLIGEYAPLSPRDTLIRIILEVNAALGYHASSVGGTWRKFYRELRYHENIDVMKRKEDGTTGKRKDPSSLVSLIRETEWPRVMRCAAYFCACYSVDPWYATNDATVEKYHLDSATYDGKIWRNKKMLVTKYA